MNRPSDGGAGGGGEPFGWEHWAAALLLAAMALITFLNVLSRYLLHRSVSFTEEITINLFVFLTVVGSGLAFARGGQLGMVTLYRHFPVGLQRAVTILSAALAAALFVVVDVLLIRTIYYEMALFRARSSALDIPVWLYYAVVPVLSLAVFRGVCRGAARQWRAAADDAEETG